MDNGKGKACIFGVAGAADAAAVNDAGGNGMLCKNGKTIVVVVVILFVPRGGRSVLASQNGYGLW